MYSPSDLRPVLEALQSFGGPISKARLASHIGTTRTSSIFKSRLGAAGYYGFITTGAEFNVAITPRGEALLSSDAKAAQAAAREGIMVSGFGAVVRRLVTRDAKETVVATVLADTTDMPEKASETVARILIAACTDSGLITAGRFDAGPIESAMSTVGEISARRQPATRNAAQKEKRSATRAKSPLASVPAAAEPRRAEVTQAADQSSPFGGVGVVLQIDASKLSAKEIKELIRELAQTTTTV
jgi:hypothetical protein